MRCFAFFKYIIAFTAFMPVFYYIRFPFFFLLMFMRKFCNVSFFLIVTHAANSFF